MGQVQHGCCVHVELMLALPFLPPWCTMVVLGARGLCKPRRRDLRGLVAWPAYIRKTQYFKGMHGWYEVLHFHLSWPQRERLTSDPRLYRTD